MTRKDGIIVSEKNFNSHTREGVTNNSGAWQIAPDISTHTPVRVWLSGFKLLKNIGRFQLTHPWGCDVFRFRILLYLFSFQLTHPWGCDENGDLIHIDGSISTHTPVRVWRDVKGTYMKSLGISTHTPVRVWPIFPFCIPWDFVNFNSHTREGVTLPAR